MTQDSAQNQAIPQDAGVESDLPPPGYEPCEILSDFPRMVARLYVREDSPFRYIGTRVQQKHCNYLGVAHGGFLMTLIDYALTYGTETPQDPRAVTLSLTTEFAGTASRGDWVAAQIDVLRLGKSVKFSNCDVWAGEERIVHASGIFKVYYKGQYNPGQK